jgi:T5SS/PEP-CTERM-associated repeat protein
MATYWFEFNLNDPGDTANLLDYVVGTYQQYVNFQAPHPTTPPGPGDTVNFYGGNALDFIAHGETWGVVTGGNLDSGDLTVDVANGLNISENGLPVYGRISGPLQILWTPVAGPAMLTATTATACFVGAQGVLDANDADAVIVQGGTVNADEITNTHDAYPSNWAVTMQFGNGYIGGTGGGARGGGAAGGGKVTAVNIINTTGAGIGMFADANGDAGIVTATNVYSTGDVGMTNTINGANQSLTVDNYDTNDQTPAGLTNLLTISDGGSVTILDSMGLGRQKGDNSTVNVTGADSSFTVDVPLTIGDAGSSVGALTVADDANATIAGDLTLQDNAKIGDSGALTAAEGGISITSGGSIEVGGSAAAPADTLRIAEGASLTGHGRITGAPTGTVPVSGSTTAPTYSLNIDNEGTIEASNGTLILDGNVSGDGQFLVGANSTLEFGGTVADGVTAMFLPGGGQTIIIDDPADFKGVISSENLESGDAIDLPNVPYIDPGSADLNPDGASYQFETGEGQQNYVLQVVENDQTYDIPINQDVPFEGSFTLTDDGDGGTLVTYSAVSQTGYSVTAVADSLPLNNAGVVKLFYKNIYTNQLTYSGTGFIVGQNLILTAAHVANVTNYSRANGYILWAYAPGRVAALPELLKPVGEQVTFLSPGVPDAKYNSLTDWAYLYVPGPPFSKTQGFSLPSKDIPLKTVTVTGYPGLVQGQNKDTGSVTVHGGLLTYPNKIAASGESGGPVWIENKLNHIKDYVGVHIAEGEALSITKIPAPDRLNPPRHFFLDPPSNAARITSAVVIQTGDADSGQTVQFVLNMSENVAVTGGGPTLILNDGGVATYNAASSTGTELEFDYTVGAGDQTSNLEVTQVNSTQTVQAPGGANVDFTVLDSQPTNLSINSPLVVTSIASPQTGEVGAGLMNPPIFERLEKA